MEKEDLIQEILEGDNIVLQNIEIPEQYIKDLDVAEAIVEAFVELERRKKDKKEELAQEEFKAFKKKKNNVEKVKKELKALDFKREIDGEMVDMYALDKTVRNNKRFVKIMSGRFPKMFSRIASAKLQENEVFIYDLIKTYPQLYTRIDKGFREDPVMVLNALIGGKKITKYKGKDIKFFKLTFVQMLIDEILEKRSAHEAVYSVEIIADLLNRAELYYNELKKKLEKNKDNGSVPPVLGL